MKFEDYPIAPEIKKAISKAGFRRPTDIQYKAIPNILKGEDVLAVAQTGTGKTAAFAIPILHAINQKKKNERRADGVKCIVLVPTHELAMQITGVFEQLAKHTPVRVMALIGGVEQDPQIKKLESRVDIVVATPGRMFDLIAQGHLVIHRVNTLVLDEADHMLDLGFLGDIYDLVKKLPRKRQTLFFSATINKRIKKLAYSLIDQKAIRIQISPKDLVSKNVEHFVSMIDMDNKRFFLERFIQENELEKILVFVRTKVRAERVLKAMERVNISGITLHGDKSQKERTEILKTFRDGGKKLLITTDVAARGIDIPDVDFVVNYDLPDKAENYVHRVGRTGRGDRQGQAYSFCSDGEKEMLKEIEAFLKKEITVLKISDADVKETVVFSNPNKTDLEKLMEYGEELERRKKKGKKKK